jgi:membrane-bound serine protease (ClpP class)
MRKIVLFFLFCSVATGYSVAQKSAKKVMVMEIRSAIDTRMARYVKLALAHAEKTSADYIIVSLDTFGGTLTDAKDIVDLIMTCKIPIWVFINSDAASAGALISIACDSIYMAPGATIGAATVVEGGTGAAAPDKYQSYMRSIMRSTAEENHRDPRIAEGMVDERIVIDSVKQAGKVITFTTSEAIQHGYCEAKVSSIAEILKRNNITAYVQETFHLSVADKIVAFFLNPVISGILILIILAGIYFEFQTPGATFPIIAALFALVLYLVPYYLNGLAQYWEIIALFVGILLLLAEIFIIPGFGVAGIAGLALTIVALILIMLNNDFFNFEFVPLSAVYSAAFSVLGGVAGSVLLLIFAGPRVTQSRAFRNMTLTETQKAEHGYTVNILKESMVGKKGVAYTVLRPSGKVMIDQRVYDAFTRGDYIEPGMPVEVVSLEGMTLRVRTTDPAENA